MGCDDCGAADARIGFGDAQLCDGCFNDRIGARLGLPRLPPPPPPLALRGPDGRDHRLRYRFLRGPAGLEVGLEETSAPVREGYEFAVLGDHDADVGALVEHVTATARREVGRLYLEPAGRAGWIVAEGEDEVAGRFIWNDDSGEGRPFNVVVDGRVISWEELGRALESNEGWNFRLVIEDRVEEGRSEAAVIDISSRGRTQRNPGHRR